MEWTKHYLTTGEFDGEVGYVFADGGVWVICTYGPDGYGLVYRSGNNGELWSTVSLPTASQDGAVCGAVSDGTWIMGTWDGAILRSTIQGSSWTNISTPTTQTLNFVYGNQGTWVAAGNWGTLLRSTNDGLTWSEHSIIGSASIGTGAGAGSNIILISTNNDLFVSHDMMVSGQWVLSPDLWTVGYGAGLWLGASSGVNRALYESSDGGLSWHELTSPSITEMHESTFGISNLEYSAGRWVASLDRSSETHFYYSDDLGITWVHAGQVTNDSERTQIFSNRLASYNDRFIGAGTNNLAGGYRLFIVRADGSATLPAGDPWWTHYDNTREIVC